MRRIPPTLALAAALLASSGAAVADTPTVDGSALASVALCRASDGGVYAAATIESRLGFRLTGDVDLLVNGNVVKLDPVDTKTVAILNEPVGDGGAPVTACVIFVGELHVDGGATRPVDRQDCDHYLPRALRPVGGPVIIPGRALPDLAEGTSEPLPLPATRPLRLRR
jgi:hypothetical protein